MVAIVAQVPDRKGEAGGVITSNEFDRALDQAAAQHGRQAAPGPNGSGYGKLKNRALLELLEDSWIRGQAAEMGIGVRPRQVTRMITLLKQIAFESSEAQYRHFLKEAHYAKRDIVERVEVQILAEHISANIAPGLGKKATQKAFSKFVTEYNERWRSRTVCAPGYITELCSNGPEPKGP